MPVLQSGVVSNETSRPWRTRKMGDFLQQRPDAVGLVFADQRCVLESTGAYSACGNYTTARVVQGWRHSPECLSVQKRKALPALTMLDDRAKILLKTLVERYIADGQPVGSRTLSRASGLELVTGDHPQRDGRPGRPGPDRQPAHQRRAGAHGTRLPPVRRHHADGPPGGIHDTPPEMAACRPSCSPISRSA
jgi:hypothetical protein